MWYVVFYVYTGPNNSPVEDYDIVEANSLEEAKDKVIDALNPLLDYAITWVVASASKPEVVE